MFYSRQQFIFILILCLTSLLYITACGSSSTVSVTGSKFTVGGVVNDLTGTGLVLQNNDGDDLDIINNGSFAFAGLLNNTDAYNVTVLTQPTSPDETCLITNGTGSISLADVIDIHVGCGPYCTDKGGCSGAVDATCNSATTCQGTRVDVTCTSNQCGTITVDDDSACDSNTIAKTCGLYVNVMCSGGSDQTEPQCATTCFDNADCIVSAFCNISTQCEFKKNTGQSCSNNYECINDSCNVSNQCD